MLEVFYTPFRSWRQGFELSALIYKFKVWSIHFHF